MISPESRALTLRLVARLIHAYPNWKPTDEAVKVYVEELADLPFADLSRAVTTIIRTDPSGFAPSIGRIRSEAVLDLVTDNRPALGTSEQHEARRIQWRQLDEQGGAPTKTMLETAEDMGCWHLAYHMRHPGGGATRIPGVVRIFPERNAECPCQECGEEFRSETA